MLAARTREPELRRGLARARDDEKVFEDRLAGASSATAARPARSRVANPPAEREDVDLVFVLGVRALARDAVELEEVVDRHRGRTLPRLSHPRRPPRVRSARRVRHHDARLSSRAAPGRAARPPHAAADLAALDEETGFDVRLKAELFQRTGSYKIRGPLVKLSRLSDEERAPRRRLLLGRKPRAGRRARGRDARRPRGRLHGRERDAVEGRGDEGLRRRGRPARDDLGRRRRRRRASSSSREGLTYVHPFDDVDLISGQGTRRARGPRGLARGGAGRRADRRRRADLRRLGRDQAGAPRRPDRRRRVVRRAGDEDERRGAASSSRSSAATRSSTGCA